MWPLTCGFCSCGLCQGLTGLAQVVLACVDHRGPRLREDRGAGLRRSQVSILALGSLWQTLILGLVFGLPRLLLPMIPGPWLYLRL
jgi:hypothetical protein